MATDSSSAHTSTGTPTLRIVKNIGWYVLLTALSFIILFPLYAMMVRAISEPIAYLRSTVTSTGLSPIDSDWGVFGDVAVDSQFRRAMFLSLITSLVIVVAQSLTSILAAYALAFLDFPGKKIAFAVILGTLLLPIEVTLISNIETVRDLGWFNSVQGLTAPFLVSALGIFLIRQAFLGVPHDLRDAANLDGYSHMRFLFTVVIPISRPLIGSFVLISFLSAWNQYLWPRFAADQDSYQTIQVALRTLGRENVENLNFGFAAAALSALPLVIVLIVFQRQIIRGLTAGAVKG